MSSVAIAVRAKARVLPDQTESCGCGFAPAPRLKGRNGGLTSLDTRAGQTAGKTADSLKEGHSPAVGGQAEEAGPAAAVEPPPLLGLKHKSCSSPGMAGGNRVAIPPPLPASGRTGRVRQ